VSVPAGRDDYVVKPFVYGEHEISLGLSVRELRWPGFSAEADLEGPNRNPKRAPCRADRLLRRR
jgi:hypothetical protein